MRHTGHLNKRLISLAIGSALLIAGCASSPERTVQSSEVTRAPVEQQPQLAVTPEHKLLEAKKVWQQQRDKRARDALLLDATDLYLEQGDALLAQQVLLELKQDGIEPQLHDRFALLLAEAYIDSADPTKLHELLEGLSTSAAKRARIQTNLFAKQGLWADAANSVLNTSLSAEEKVEKAWRWIKKLDSQALNKADKQLPALRPFIALRKLTQQYAESSSQLRQGLRQFQRSYPGHMLANYLPDDIEQAKQVSAPDLNEVAVLLPLSERLAATGEAVKDGIMAAYYQQLRKPQEANTLPALRFIDTVGKSPETLVSEMGDAKFVVGPLLKDTVEALIPLLPVGVNMLALNRIEGELALNSTQTTSALSPLSGEAGSHSETRALNEVRYFALAPEDEAQQLAEFIFHKGLRAPIVVAAQSSLYTRMHDAFKDRWYQLHQQRGTKAHVTTVTFNDSGSLRDGITQALDVAQSNQRINQIEYMVNEDVYNMPRSRRDIDAIVGFASPQDTELLNPIIEASLNPYDGTQVPVYATSRSMDYDSGKNQWRDLQNVRFIDMPWMMPSHPWPQLADETQAVWPQRTTMQNRLFAFGVDAYNLLPQLGMLTVLPYLEFQGLTGNLRLSKEGKVTRHLPQAVIKNERVQMLAE